jgi:murein DD-endopeptidase MepM/ murein hydrolase activator NlpD
MQAVRGGPHDSKRRRRCHKRRPTTATSQRLRTDSVPIHAHPGDLGRSGRTVAHVRATSPPTALTVATAALAAAVLIPPAVPSSALAGRWLRPVPGEVARSFSYARAAPFERGAHRGVDLAAAPGALVRSACTGTVVHAGPVARAGGVVSVRCGARRVSYLPLARVAVRAGAATRAGAPIGTVAAGHGGLHLGVRREADRFGYEDPLALIAPRRTAPRTPTTPPAARPPSPRRAPRPVAAPRVPAARPAAAPRVPAHGPRPVAPWAVWGGLGLVLAGAVGSGTVVVRRRRAARAPAMRVETLRRAA